MESEVAINLYGSSAPIISCVPWGRAAAISERTKLLQLWYQVQWSAAIADVQALWYRVRICQTAKGGIKAGLTTESTNPGWMVQWRTPGTSRGSTTIRVTAHYKTVKLKLHYASLRCPDKWGMNYSESLHSDEVQNAIDTRTITDNNIKNIRYSDI